MKRTDKHISIPALVRAMQEGGAVFRAMPGGTWVVEGLGSLPCAIRDEFYEADSLSLGAHLRATMGGGLGKAERAEAFAVPVA